MREGRQPPKPTITMLSASPGPVEDHVLAGAEEEGVPVTVERPTKPCGAEDLAIEAALTSALGVGVGIDASGHVCISHEKLRYTLADLSFDGATNLASARVAGHNAARLVVGVPLRLPAARMP
ncbi:MAG: glycerol dehydratase reactivase beta/small subunit family protein [Methylobacterium radiotolerans]